MVKMVGCPAELLDVILTSTNLALLCRCLLVTVPLSMYGDWNRNWERKYNCDLNTYNVYVRN